MRPIPQKIVEGLTTKSAKIRALHAAGFERTEIRDFLKISYQHVRNVLVQAGQGSTSQSPSRGKVTSTPRPKHVPWSSEQLLDGGFALLGEWQSIDDLTFKLSVTAPNKPGVYAFTVDGVVKYIGLTQTGIKTRMGHYRYGHAQQRTSARVKALILGALAAGSKVEVLIAFPPPLEWGRLPVDGAAGLEAGLLRVACPAWNKQGITPSLDPE